MTSPESTGGHTHSCVFHLRVSLSCLFPTQTPTGLCVHINQLQATQIIQGHYQRETDEALQDLQARLERSQQEKIAAAKAQCIEQVQTWTRVIPNIHVLCAVVVVAVFVVLVVDVLMIPASDMVADSH